MIGDVPSAARRRFDQRSENSVIHEATAAATADDRAVSKSSSEDAAVVMDGMKVEMLQERMQEMRQSVVNDLNARLNDVMSEMVQELRENKTKGKDAPVEEDHRRKDGKLADKKFLPRNSFLTDLYEINHIRTIYNIFVVMLLILFLNTAVHDYFETGSTHLGIRTVKLAFGKFATAAQIWILMLLSTFTTYLGFSMWVQKRSEYFSKPFYLKVVDYGFLSVFIINQLVFIVLPTKRILEEDLPPACSLMVLMEQVRMLMKTHAFVRSTAPRFLSVKQKSDDIQNVSCPGFSKFLYFMFAPTLIYRDDYPRTKQIRWKVVTFNFAEVLLVIFYTAFIFERFIMPPFEKYGPQIFEPQTVILTTFSIILPGLIMFLFGFYCVLHSTQNCMAELLTFADRQFYKDWWNCSSYDVYYRIWNIIVHDWLYTYVYKDICEKIHNRFLATVMVFLVSAVFHEYILAFSFRFFYPVMLLMFGGFGMLFVFLTKEYMKEYGNIFLWFTLFAGNGLIFTLYSMEYYARKHCPPYENQIVDLLLPRSWVCHIKSNSSLSVNAIQ